MATACLEDSQQQCVNQLWPDEYETLLHGQLLTLVREQQKNEGSRLTLRLLGEAVCAGAFQRLLGLGTGRWRKLAGAMRKGTPLERDGRFLTRTKLCLISKKHSQKAAVITEFLEEMLQTISEPMPEAWRKPAADSVPRELQLRRPRGRRPMRSIFQPKKNAAPATAPMRLLPPGTYSDYLRMLNDRLAPGQRISLKTFNKVPSSFSS